MGIKSKNSFIVILLLVIITFVIFLNFYLSTSSNNTPVTIIKNVNCQVDDNVCEIKSAEFNVKLVLDKDILYLKPFKISATTQVNSQVQIKNIQLGFYMSGMDMGINRFVLNTDSKSTEPKIWIGSGIIPICVSGRADWIADLDVFTERNHYRVSFPIIIKKNK